MRFSGKIEKCSLSPIRKFAPYAAKAEQKYREILSESRTGISYTEEEIKALDELISPLVKQGQSPHHIYATNKDSIMVSERTIYNLIGASVVSARNIDLPRRVRFKPRKKKQHFKVDRACRIGRGEFLSLSSAGGNGALRTAGRPDA